MGWVVLTFIEQHRTCTLCAVLRCGRELLVRLPTWISAASFHAHGFVVPLTLLPHVSTTLISAGEENCFVSVTFYSTGFANTLSHQNGRMGIPIHSCSGSNVINRGRWEACISHCVKNLYQIEIRSADRNFISQLPGSRDVALA